MAAQSPRAHPRTRSRPRQQDLPLELPAPPPLIPLDEAQRWLGVSAATFTRLLWTGELPVVHLGRKVRIAEPTLLAWLAAHGRLPVLGKT
jgi:excisionase family DNA binding protein